MILYYTGPKHGSVPNIGLSLNVLALWNCSGRWWKGSGEILENFYWLRMENLESCLESANFQQQRPIHHSVSQWWMWLRESFRLTAARLAKLQTVILDRGDGWYLWIFLLGTSHSPSAIKHLCCSNLVHHRCSPTVFSCPIIQLHSKVASRSKGFRKLCVNIAKQQPGSIFSTIDLWPPAEIDVQRKFCNRIPSSHQLPEIRAKEKRDTL